MKGIIWFLRTLSSRSKMATDHSIVVKSGETSNSVKSNTCDSSGTYFLSIEVWNTVCTTDKADGRAN